MVSRVLLAAALGIVVGGCAEVPEGGPLDIPPKVQEKYCIKEAALISNLLTQTDALTSCISQSSCDRRIDTEEEGYFETWHLYADETSTLVLDADSEFDNLMKLALIIEVTEQAVEAKVLAVNDDRSADDSRARIAATLEAGEDYLLRLSSFGDEETGCYTIQTIRVAPDDPVPERPDTGSIGVIVSSAGAAPASYTVTLNDAKAKSVAPNGTATYEDIVTGDYAVELSGLGGCVVNGDNPQNATVNANQTTTVSLAVSCEVPDCDPNDSNSCDDGNDCTADGTCNRESLECEGGSNQPLDTPCGTGGVCDAQGKCVECNAPQQCDQGNECTDDNCDAGSCGHEIAAGRACDYMGLNEAGICNEQGQCEKAPPMCDPNPCKDTGDDCTEEICNPSDGTCPVMSVSDGTTCQDAPGGNPGICSSGACVGFCDGVDCSDDFQCTIDPSCNEENGECEGGGNEPAGTQCNDEPGGRVCDGNGSCVECNLAAECPEEGLECTTRSCIDSACGRSNVQDGTSCDSGAGYCMSGVCKPADCFINSDCNDGNDCTHGVCTSHLCGFVPVGNGQICRLPGNLGTCLDGVCESLCHGVDCSDDFQCTIDPSCNEENGECEGGGNEPAGTQCNDEPGGRVCDGSGHCVECNSSTDCDDSNMCTVELCLVETNSCFSPTGVRCFDGNACTMDDCDPERGCVNSSEPDRTLCSGGTCQGGVCTTSCQYCCLARRVCVDNGDGTVTDLNSGLMWIKDGNNGFVGTWQEAMAWAENLVFAGYDDWRLPDGRNGVTLLPDTTLNSSNHEWGYLYFETWRTGPGPANAEDVLPWVGMPTGGGNAWTSTSNFQGQALAFYLSFDALGLNQWALQQSQLWALAVRDDSTP